MKRWTVAAVLVLALVLGLCFAAQAAGRAVKAPGFGFTLTEEQQVALSALSARVEAGEAVNGAKNVIFARRGTGSKATSKFSLAPTPSELCTQAAYTKYGYPNTLCYLHPVLISSTDAALTVTGVTSSSSRLLVIPPTGSETRYFIQGVSKGSATLTVTASDGRTVKKTITVKDKVYIRSFSFHTSDTAGGEKTAGNAREFVFASGDTTKSFCLYAAANPTSASYGGGSSDVYTPAAVRFGSDSPYVASPSEMARDGLSTVLVLKPGKATLTARATDGGKAKGSFRVVAKGKPVTALGQIANFAMQPGATRQLAPTVTPADAWDGGLTWSSSNKKVVRVDSAGNLTALKPGTAVVTYKNRAGGLSKKVTVTVGYGKAAAGTTYRFYSYSMDPIPTITINNTIRMMEATFTNAVMYSGVTVTWVPSLRDVPIFINAFIAPTADADDVTVIYLCGYGVFAPGTEAHGALIAQPYLPLVSALTVADAQAALENTPGTVILIVDANCSGAFITSKGGTASKAAALARQKSFADAWTGAFASASASGTGLAAKGLADSDKKTKFKGLVSCSATGENHDNANGKYTWFSTWLAKGLGMTFGPDGTCQSADTTKAPADANRDKLVTLNELYKYVKAGVAGESTATKWQSVSVWPANDPTAILNPTT